MSLKHVRIQPRDLGKFEMMFPGELKRAQRQVFTTFGKLAKNALIAASARIKYKGRFRKGWKYRTTANGKKLVIWNKEAHAFWVEHGRSPNRRMPPHQPILEWAEIVLGPAVNVFALRKKIGRDGIKPRRILTDPKMHKFLTDQLVKQMGNMWDKAAAIALSGISKAGGKSGLKLSRATKPRKSRKSK